MVMYFLMHLTMWITVYRIFGNKGIEFQFWASFSNLMWLEAGNYGEHYGLRRWKDANGVWESVSGWHSWNAPASVLSFKIQRHSDHHCHGFRPYQILRHYEDAPSLPYEYIIMAVIALVPPVWTYVMNPRVEAVERARSGMKKQGEEDQWNDYMPKSAADKQRDLHVKIYVLAFTGFLAYKTW